jgi:rhamnose utilization protein RhaD (predicted bifunctional aldolase and dehydrogenase)
MNNLWNEDEAAAYVGDLAQRVYSSRLLGRDAELVLHGGGNTSVKITENNILGEPEDILYVKGSGWDLETIEEGGFAPVRMGHMLALAGLETLSDPQMVNELRTNMTDAAAPTPSVETILHAILPYRYVDHTHADAVVTVTNTANGEERIREIYGDRVVVIPYTMPGFDLARVCAEIFPREAGADTIGMVLMNHGIFSFGATARESYERMIELVGEAEDYLKAQQAWDLPHPAPDERRAEPGFRQPGRPAGDIATWASDPRSRHPHEAAALPGRGR